MKSLFDSCEPDLALVSAVKLAFQKIESLPLGEQIETINHIKIALHEVSPFKSEPVDCVVWKESDEVNANDYNPNSVAPPLISAKRFLTGRPVSHICDTLIRISDTLSISHSRLS